LLLNIFPRLDPQSPYARPILDLGIVMLIVVVGNSLSEIGRGHGE